MSDAIPSARPREHATRPAIVRRDVGLLPRHWDWLATQPTGADAALRRLVDQARRDADGRYRRRAAQDACYALMRRDAGDRPHFEDAVRAVYASDLTTLRALIADWPQPLREAIERTLVSPPVPDSGLR